MTLEIARGSVNINAQSLDNLSLREPYFLLKWWEHAGRMNVFDVLKCRRILMERSSLCITTNKPNTECGSLKKTGRQARDIFISMVTVKPQFSTYLAIVNSKPLPESPIWYDRFWKGKGRHELPQRHVLPCIFHNWCSRKHFNEHKLFCFALYISAKTAFKHITLSHCGIIESLIKTTV